MGRYMTGYFFCGYFKLFDAVDSGYGVCVLVTKSVGSSRATERCGVAADIMLVHNK